MTHPGRSLDDLPLAAYSTRVAPDETPGELPDESSILARSEPPAPPPTFAPVALGAAEASLPVAAPGAAPVAATAVAARRPELPDWLANPRANLRDPRLLMTAVIGVGVVLLAGSLLLGGGPSAGAASPGASPTRAPLVVVTAAPPTGDASVEVSGKPAGSFLLAGATGTGPATGGRVDVTWTEASGTVLSLSGPASPGTRTTDATFVLAWTTLVDGVAVTFTSDDGECTVGMAVQPKSVTGSFVCKKLKSPDGKLTIDLRGTYRT